MSKKDRGGTKFVVGLLIVLYGPDYANQLEQRASREADPKQREFYSGAAKIVREAVKDPGGAVDALEELWDTIFED